MIGPSILFIYNLNYLVFLISTALFVRAENNSLAKKKIKTPIIPPTQEQMLLIP